MNLLREFWHIIPWMKLINIINSEIAHQWRIDVAIFQVHTVPRLVKFTDTERMMNVVNKRRQTLQGKLNGNRVSQKKWGKLDKKSSSGNMVQAGLMPRTDNREETSILTLCYWPLLVQFGIWTPYNHAQHNIAFKAQIVPSVSNELIPWCVSEFLINLSRRICG